MQKFSRSTIKKQKQGFTLVETTLFIAISGFLIISVIAGTSTVVSRHRYNDSVQNFAEFMRRSYSEVSNVQNSQALSNLSKSCTSTSLVNSSGKIPNINNLVPDPTNEQFPGRSDCAIYGKLINFYSNKDQASKIKTYNIIGRAVNSGDLFDQTSTLELLSKIQADFSTINITRADSGQFTCKYQPLGTAPEYTLEWESRLENPDGSPLNASVVIIRSPLSGVINTYILKQNPNDHANHHLLDSEKLFNKSLNCSSDGSLTGFADAKSQNLFLADLFNHSDNNKPILKSSELDFCVNSNDRLGLGHSRRNIRLAKDGRNATAVDLVTIDGHKEYSQDKSAPGNRCQ